MAEAVIRIIAEEIVSFLVSQGLENVGKLGGVKHEFKALKDTVSTIQAVLDHAEENYYQSTQTKNWVEKLKDIFYDAQDVFEEFNIEALRRELRGHNEISKEVRTFFSSSTQLAFNLKMSYKVRALRERIEAIQDSKGLHLEERLVSSRVEGRCRESVETHSLISEGDIKGRDEDKKKVKETLLDSNTKENLSILPIVGIGGLGKTALAQFVYNDETVARHFDLKMWICVSDDFDVKEIVKKMIDWAMKGASSEVTLDQLQRELKAKIGGKRYLLVLDDLWITKLEPWMDLKKLLEGGARGSKILITTRLSLTAEIIGTVPSHLLRGLSESASLDLLMQIASGEKEEIRDPDMLAIGKEIVSECYGVPLVVRTIGSLLFFKKTESEWRTVRILLFSKKTKFKRRNHYKLSTVSQVEDHINSVLRRSYDHLPPHLKQCFALCSLFPKDHEIKKQTLIDLWMAEGFIEPSHENQHLEDVANGYFMDLLWRNFFQNYQKDQETCKMHDLMHDLACLVAGNECRMVGDGTKTIHERTRHISMGSLPISCLKAKPIRTFLSSMPRQRSEADLRQLIKSFKRLHIWDLHASCIEKVPRSIGKLKYLTYLDFSENGKLKRLPKSITRLQNLQTLNLYRCYSLEELPRDIRKLVSLRNLDIDGCEKLSYMPQGWGN